MSTKNLATSWARFRSTPGRIARYVLNARALSTESPCASRTISQSPTLGLQNGRDLFNYTRGRFITDEQFELSQRCVDFNVDALARCAAETVGAESCISIEKYPDGMYNKSMLLTMDNGSQVVAKIPNPNAGIPHLTTASEVATMEFIREKLGTPVPKVLAWSSRAQSNPIGAEYIIMEKASGVELEQIWPSLDIKERFAVVKAVAGYQKSWNSISFKKFGGLYYKKDLDSDTGNDALYVDADGHDIVDTKYAIGPSPGREWIDNGRVNIKLDRGPWKTLTEFHSAIGKREITCINQLPHLPKSPVTLYGPGIYIPTRERKLEALHCYMTLLDAIVPSNSAISSAHLWHEDLHVANIFVNPSNPAEVVSIIDWQSTEISPLYFLARQPHLIDHAGTPVTGIERPQYPADFHSMDPEAKKAAETRYFQRSLCALYNFWVYKANPKLHAAFEFQRTPEFSLLLLARNIIIDGEATYLAQVLELEKLWDTLPGAKNKSFPLNFSTQHRARIAAELEGAEEGMNLMSSIRDSIGELFPEQGIVRHDQYDETLDALAQMKTQIIEQFAKNEQEKEEWERLWPFGQ
ncbi:hypothetical protein EJ05DRAFT_465617 [Pseudovirgaria hyperparasitica]|uniref:Altered inheritance of mitochondria protein 9, mitochondrial n=1 Tax=Pseudovirgaria hyperparasitica TaxID=470096 RepID=A0A6A6W6F3_9PEZI|nr:uncharacterized protein EJ05DRAFT_465617 [Pseudovirgaria hyperparasitica]KAF2757486.1 hypothetical protein EJ05DRAFT_465617 [Pseudovirgaria hyperparasitica]